MHGYKWPINCTRTRTGMLPLLNRAEFAHLWLRTPEGKAVYFVHGPPGCRPWPVGGLDPLGHSCDGAEMIRDEIEANGGAHNVCLSAAISPI